MKRASTADEDGQEGDQGEEEDDDPDALLNHFWDGDDEGFDHPDGEVDDSTEHDEADEEPQDIDGDGNHGHGPGGLWTECERAMRS